MTIYDISQKAGVSIATVSRVLNGSSKVSPKTKKKVMEVVEEFSYTPNAFARGLGLNTIQTIGILCADSSDLYLAKAVYHLEQFLRENGYDSILCCTGYELANKHKYMNLLLSKKVDSIILVGSNFVEANEKDNLYIKEAAKNIPIMLLNAEYPVSNVYSSLCDDFQAISSATGKLISHGCKNILYLYNSTSYSGSRKLSGYESAMSNAGLSPASHYVARSSTNEIKDVAAYVESLYEKGLRFDAVIAAEDSLALGAVKYASKAGIKIPDELSVIGFNNSLLTVCCEPELTSIDNRLELLCRQLVRNLVEVLSGNEIPQKTIYSGELVLRGTTAFE